VDFGSVGLFKKKDSSLKSSMQESTSLYKLYLELLEIGRYFYTLSVREVIRDFYEKVFHS